MTSEEIREAFLQYFESQDHLRVASSSLIPVGDPTLLLTSAGMVQFKAYFAGEVKPPSRRLTSSQKAFRTTDVEEVGDDTHLTMFEMLGNFSIGDYFKDGAMKLAIECLETTMGLPRERFAATVHHTDDEARELWQKHGIPADRIYAFGDEENWWGPAGDEGPTGPCAELHYDFRDDRPGCGLDDCGPNCANLIPGTDEECRRYVELWNLVFMQYYHNLDGSRPPLPSTGIDTGMGFERLVSVMQDVPSYFDTDLFTDYIKKVEEISGKGYESDADTRYAMRVVTEHARSATFLIGDGVVPANEGRGYVLRRVIRRAIRHGRGLGLEDPFLGEVASVVIDKMGPAYPELKNNREFVLKVLGLEENKFTQSVDRGIDLLLGEINGLIPRLEALREKLDEFLDPLGTRRRLYSPEQLEDQLTKQISNQTENRVQPIIKTAVHESLVEPLNKLVKSLIQGDDATKRMVRVIANTIPGKVAFVLWDTYGFPVEMTQEIAAERGFEVDLERFEREMAAQRARARASSDFGGDRSKIKVYEGLGVGATAFLGYEQLGSTSVVVGLISGDDAVDKVAEGGEVEVVLQQTPFYAEGGGQIGDAGEIAGDGFKVEVHDTQRVMPDLIVHFGKVTIGTATIGASVDAHVNETRRQDIARNHTATHMLHAALRIVLGHHVRQAGSLVAPDRLRFDFSHGAPMTDEEMRQVQSLVNERIRQDVGVHKSDDTYAHAIERGALAFFGDKYDERVRLIEIANGDVFSFEVCGGTHVHQTGELGSVYVLGESSIGAGMRRLEAVSGRAAERMVRESLLRERDTSQLLQTAPGDIPDRIRELQEEIGSLRRDNETLQRRLSMQSAEELLDARQDVDGVSVLASQVSVAQVEGLREMGDWLRDKMGSGVVVLGAAVDDRPVLVAMVTADLIERGLDASVIARGAAKAIKGGGGGRPDVAQAGGKDASGLGQAMELVPDLVREAVDGS